MKKIFKRDTQKGGSKIKGAQISLQNVLVHGVHSIRIVRNRQDFWKYLKMSGKMSGFWDFPPKCQDLSGCSTMLSNFPCNINF